MAGLTSGLNANVTKTALDDVFFQKYAAKQGPNLTSAQDNMVFIQDSTDRAAVILEHFKGVGLWEDTPEQAEYKGDTPLVTNQITFSVARFTKKFHITEEMIEDDLHRVVRNAISQMGTKAKVSQNTKSMEIYRNAATTTLTADGAALLSASHTSINGSTVDNTISGAFTVDTLEEGIKDMLESKDQADDIIGHEAKTILIPPELYKEVVEITESRLEANTTDNNMNVFSAKYGLTIRQSQYLGAAAGGKDGHWFLMGEFHSVMRFKRIPVQTRLLSGDFQENGDSVYRGRSINYQLNHQKKAYEKETKN
jgi:phage major head subunit gpT-like protein